MNQRSPGPESGAPSRGAFLLRLVLIVGAGFWAFSPALHGGWIWDDHFLIEFNPVIQDPAGLWTAWFNPKSLTDSYPITLTVEWLEWRLWHNNTLGYHLVDLGCHLAGSLLVWRLFHRLGLKWAWLGGLIFAIHPVNVESAAWAAELKNTLSLPPFLLAMCAYIDYDERGRNKDYLLSLSLFLVAMLCKTTMVTFPLVILLYAWWKRGRVGWTDLKSSAPFFAVSLVLGAATFSLITFSAEGHHVPTGGLLSHVVSAGLIVAFYFSSCVLPLEQMPCYPRWVVDPSMPIQFLPYPVLIGVLVWLWIKRAAWGRHALLGLGFFLITVSPFAWIVSMDFSWTMDHLVYIPLIGLVGLTVAGLENLEPQIPRSFRPLGIGAMTAAIAFLGWKSHSYSAIFANEKVFWNYAVAHDPGSWMAHSNLGATLTLEGDTTGAIEQFDVALQIFPSPNAHNNLGLALMQANRLTEAIAQFEASLQLNPHFLTTYHQLGLALMEAGRVDEAKQQFETALQLDPHDGYAKRYLDQIELTEKATLPDQ